ncbi:filamentous hemagglutinin N-terminal domain-containing protein [Roseomonas sp. BN140053]|uniref:two-partner secretion domain-containing protein n=1 Tax=Roseomonas sp. BN140053 TaxID=3391898 RepID=UPI0039E7BB5F
MAEYAAMRAGALRAWLLGTTALLPAAPALAQAPDAAPQGGRVVAGQAGISRNGTTTTITQGTERAAIDWQRFDVGRNQSVQFQQPSAQSWTLNRVTTPDPSLIAGRVSANGGVAIVNPSGVVFAQGAQVNVGSLIASAANITNENFMAGRMVFDGAPRPGARVENHGDITVADRGLAALVGPRVGNTGTIRARLGKVALQGAETYALDLAGDGLLSIDVTQAVRTAPDGGTAIVTNSGTIEAAGGSVLLSANAASGLVEDVVRNSGRISAPTANGRPGQVALRGTGGGVRVAGSVSATGGAGERGGSVEVLAEGGTARVVAGAVVDASGGSGGGRIAVGADAASPAGRPARRATRTAVERGATLRADATVRGNGGAVIVNGAESVSVAGNLSARGGPQGGDGGLVEASSGGGMNLSAGIDVSAPAGRAGEFLLDPQRIRVVATASEPTAPDTNEAPTAGTGLVTANSPDDAGEVRVTAGSINLFDGTVRLSATRGIAVDAAVTKLTAGGLLLETTGTAGLEGLGISVTQPVILLGGAFGAETQGLFSMTGAGAVTAVGATVAANAMQLDATLRSVAPGTLLTDLVGLTSSGTVTLRPFSTGTTIALAAPAEVAGALNLSQDELGRVRAGTLVVGGSDAGGLNLGGNVALDTGTIDRLELRSGASVTQTGGTLAVPELVAVAAIGNVALDNGGNAIPVLAGGSAGVATGDASAANGNVTVATAGNLSVTGAVSAATDVRLRAGNTLSNSAAIAAGTGRLLNLVADGMAIGAGLGAAGGTVALHTATAARPISLGTAIGGENTAALDLSEAELRRITANRLSIGNAGQTGGVTVAGPVDLVTEAPQRVNTLDLQSAGAVTQGTGASLAAPALSAHGSSVTLTEAGNSLPVLQDAAAAIGSFAVRTGADMAVAGTITAATGITLQAGGPMSVQAGGSVQATGAASLTAGSDLTAGGTVSGRGVTLRSTAGTVSNSAAVTGGADGVSLFGAAISLGAAVGSATGAVGLDASGGITVTGTGSVSGTAVTAEARGAEGIAVNGSATATSGDLGLTATAGGIRIAAGGERLTVQGSAGHLGLAAGGGITLGGAASSAGTAQLAAGAGQTLEISAGGSLRADNGAALRADTVVLDGTVTSSAGPVGLVTATDGRAIQLGGTDPGSALMLSDAALGRITAPVLRVGERPDGAATPATAGNAVTLAGDVGLRDGVSRLELFGSSVAQTGGGLDVARVDGSVSGSFALGSATNTLDEVGGLSAGTGARVFSSTGLTVSGDTGTEAGALRLESGGALRLTGTATAPTVNLWGRSVALQGAVSSGLGTGTVTVVASGGAPDGLGTPGTIGADIAQTAAGRITAGNLYLHAAGNASLEAAGNQVDLLGGRADGGSLLFRSTRTLEVGRDQPVIPLPAGGTVTPAYADVAAPGTVRLTAPTLRILDSGAPPEVFANGSAGSVVLNADALSIAGRVEASGGTVTLRPQDGRGLTLGGTGTGTLDLSADTLARIVADRLILGQSGDGGAVRVAGAVDLAGLGSGGTLELRSAGTIAQDPGATLTAAGLAATGSSIALGETNGILRLSGLSDDANTALRSGGDVTLRSAGDLAVNADVLAGAAGTVDLRAADLALAARVAGATVRLAADGTGPLGGNIAQAPRDGLAFDAARDGIAAGTLFATAGGSVLLDAATAAGAPVNAVERLGGAGTGATGRLALSSSRALTVAGAVSAGDASNTGGGNLLASAGKLDLQAGVESGGRIALRAGGSLTQSGSGTVAAPELLAEGRSGVALTLDNRVGNLAGSAAEGGFSFRDAPGNALSTGLGEAQAITARDAVTLAATSLTLGGAVQSAQFAAPAAAATTPASVTLLADTLSVGGNLVQAEARLGEGGTVRIAPFTLDPADPAFRTGITLGASGAGTLSLLQGDIDGIRAGRLLIGAEGGVPITVAGGFALRNADFSAIPGAPTVLELRSGGDIAATAGGVLNVAGLAASSGGRIALDAAAQQVDAVVAARDPATGAAESFGLRAAGEVSLLQDSAVLRPGAAALRIEAELVAGSRGTLALRADDLEIGATLRAPAGTVRLGRAIAGDVALGGAPAAGAIGAVLALDAAELARIGTVADPVDRLRIDGRDIAVTGAVALRDGADADRVRLLELQAAGTVSESAAGAINVGGIAGSGASVALDGANAVDSIGRRVADGFGTRLLGATAEDGTAAGYGLRSVAGGLSLSSTRDLTVDTEVFASTVVPGAPADLRLRSDGTLTVPAGVGATAGSGGAGPDSRVRLEAGLDLLNAGSVSGPQAELFAGRDLRNTGSVAAGRDATLVAISGTLSNAALLDGSGLPVAGTGVLQAGGTLNLDATAGALSNTGEAAAGSGLVATAGTSLSNTALQQAGTGLRLAGTGVLRSAGTTVLQARGGALSNTGSVTAGTSLSATGATDLSNTALLDAAGAAVAGTGSLRAEGPMTLAATAGTLRNTGVAGAGGNLLATAGTELRNEALVNAGTVVAGTGRISADAGAATLLAGTAGRTGSLFNNGVVFGAAGLSASGRTDLSNAGLLDAAGGRVADTGLLLSDGGAVLEATNGALRNTGRIAAGSDLRATAGTDLFNTALRDPATGAAAAQTGMLGSLGTVTLTARGGTLNNSGTVSGAGLSAEATLGALSNTGRMNSLGDSGALALRAGNGLSNAPLTANGVALPDTGVLNAAGAASLTATGGNLDNAGTMAAAGLTVRAEAGDLNNTGRMSSAAGAVDPGTLTLFAQGSLSNGGALGAADAARLTAATGGLSNSGTVSGTGLSAEATLGALSNTGRLDSLGGNGALALRAGNGLSNAPQLANGVAVPNTGVMNAAGAATLTATGGNLDNAGTIAAAGLTVRAEAGNLANTGSMDSRAGTVDPGTLTLFAQGSLSNGGALGAADAASLTAVTGALNNAGTVAASGLSAEATLGALSNTGRLDSVAGVNNPGTLALRAGNGLNNAVLLDAVGNARANTGVVNAADAARLTASGGDLSNSGTVSASGLVAEATLGSLSNTGRLNSAAGANDPGTLSLLAGNALRNAPRLDAAGNPVAETGVVSAADSATLTARSGLLGNAGTVLATGAVTLAADGADLENTGTVIAGGLTVSGGELRNTGTLNSAAAAVLAARAALVNGGSALAGTTLGATAGTALTNGGTLRAGGDALVQAGTTLTTSGTAESTAGNLTLRALSGDIAQTGGGIAATGAAPGGTVRLEAGGTFLQTGGTLAARVLEGALGGSATLQITPGGPGINAVALGSFATGGDLAIAVNSGVPVLTVSGQVSAGQGGPGGARVLTISADDLALLVGAGLSAPGGVVVLRPTAEGRAVTLGGEAAGTLSLSNEELRRIGTTQLVVGSTAAGGIALAGDVDLRDPASFADPNLRELRLLTAGDIVQAQGIRLNVERLSGEAGGTVALDSRDGAGVARNVLNAVSGLVAGGDLRLAVGGLAAAGGVLPPAIDPGTGQPVGGGAALVLANLAAGTPASPGHSLVVAADDLALLGALSAPGGTVTLVPVTPGRAVALGTPAAGALSLDTAEFALAGADARTLSIGALPGGPTLAGSITLNGALSPGVAGTLVLNGTGDLFGSGAAIAVPELIARAGGNLRLDNGGNQVGRFGALGAGTGGTLSLNNAGPLVLGGTAEAPDGTIRLRSGGSITQDPGAILLGGTLDASATGAIRLGEENRIDTLLFFAAGEGTNRLRVAGPLAVNGPVSAAGALRLEAGGDLSVAAGQSVGVTPGSDGTGTLDVVSGGSLTTAGLLSAGRIGLSASLRLEATGGSVASGAAGTVMTAGTGLEVRDTALSSGGSLQLLAGREVALNRATLDAEGATLTAGDGALTAEGGRIDTRAGGSTLGASRELRLDGTALGSAGTVQLDAGGAIGLTGATLDARTASLTAQGGNIDVTRGSVTGRNGGVTLDATGSIGLDSTALTAATTAQLGAGGAIGLTDTTLDARIASLTARGGNIDVTRGSLTSRDGGTTLDATGRITLDGTSLTSTARVGITAGQSLSLSGVGLGAPGVTLAANGSTLDITGGEIRTQAAGTTLRASGGATLRDLPLISLGTVRLRSGGNATLLGVTLVAETADLAAEGGRLGVTGGRIESRAGGSTLSSGTGMALGSTVLSSPGTVRLEAGQEIALSGTTLEAGTAALDAGAGIALRNGGLSAAGTLVLDARGGLLLATSTLSADTITATAGAGLEVTGGEVSSRAGGTGLAAGGDLQLSGTTLFSLGQLQLDAGGSAGLGSSTLSAGTVAVTAEAGRLDVTGSRIASNTETRLSAGAGAGLGDSTLTAGGTVRLRAGADATILRTRVEAETLDARAGGALRLDALSAVVGNAAVFGGPGGITAGARSTVSARDPARLPAVVFDSRAGNNPDPLEQVRPDVPGLAANLQRTQVRRPNTELPGSFGLLGSGPAGNIALNLDAGRSAVFLLSNAAALSGEITAGRLGIQGTGGSAQLFGTLNNLAGAEAARAAELTRPATSASLTRYRINGCIAGAVNCISLPLALLLPPRPPERVNIQVQNNRLDTSDILVPNIAEADY